VSKLTNIEKRRHPGSVARRGKNRRKDDDLWKNIAKMRGDSEFCLNSDEMEEREPEIFDT